jgi:hypothetical protein
MPSSRSFIEKITATPTFELLASRAFIGVARGMDLSIALRDLNAKYIQHYMDEGHDPNSPFMYNTKVELVAEGNDVSTAHPLTYLLNRCVETENAVNVQAMYEDIYACGRLLLQNPHADHSRIVYEHDHLGFSPADYAACSEHSELAAEVIKDRILQDFERRRPQCFVPDYYMLALRFVSTTEDPDLIDYFAGNADGAIARVVDELIHPDLDDMFMPDTYPGKHRERTAYLHYAAGEWDKCRYQVDELLRSGLPTALERRLERHRDDYLYTSEDYDRDGRAFITAFHAIRKERLTPRPAS